MLGNLTLLLAESSQPVKWTEIVSALSSVGSAAIAAIAAVFAYSAYRKQAGQLELAQKHDKLWQAAKVAAWIDTDKTLEANGDEDMIRSLVCAFHNASELPVHHVRVVSWSGQDICKYGTLEPGGPNYVVIPELPADAGKTMGLSGLDGHPKSEQMVIISEFVETKFTDTEGRNWSRAGAGGELSEYQYEWMTRFYNNNRSSRRLFRLPLTLELRLLNRRIVRARRRNELNGTAAVDDGE